MSPVPVVCSYLCLGKKNPVVSVNGASGQSSHIPSLRRGRCGRLVIKHDLVSNSSVLLCLIFDDALYFSVCAPVHLFKRRAVIGRPAITMTDGFPGGRSAVAKALWLGGLAVHISSDRRCGAMPRLISSTKKVFFLLCSEPVLEGRWPVFTTSVWPSGRDCARGQEPT